MFLCSLCDAELFLGADCDVLPALPACSRHQGDISVQAETPQGLEQAPAPSPECCPWTGRAVGDYERLPLVTPKSHAGVRRAVLGLSDAGSSCFCESTGRVSMLGGAESMSMERNGDWRWKT